MPAMNTARMRRLTGRQASLRRRFAKPTQAAFSPEETMPWLQAAARAVAAQAMESWCARVGTSPRTPVSASAAASGTLRRRSASLQLGGTLAKPPVSHLPLCTSQRMGRWSLEVGSMSMSTSTTMTKRGALLRRRRRKRKEEPTALEEIPAAPPPTPAQV